MTVQVARRGYYLGTELNGRWWRRYARDGFLARGLGDWWLDDAALHFHRRLTRVPLGIPLVDVLEVELGRWHAGKWAGGAAVVKVVWVRDGRRLSSGFVVGRDAGGAEALAREVRLRALRARAPAGDAMLERPAEGG